MKTKYFCVIVMKKVVQNIVTPLVLFGFGLVMLGCSQDSVQNVQNTANDLAELTEQANQQVQDGNTELQQQVENLKSGSMFAIVRDVADMQLKAGHYVSDLQNTKAALEQAVQTQNAESLATATTQLSTQLQAFNASLNSVQLHSQEIFEMRENIMAHNEKILNSPWLNGTIQADKIDFAALEQQMKSIESEMLKLATMVIQGNEQGSSAS